MIDDNTRLLIMFGMMLGLIGLIIWGSNVKDFHDDDED